MSGVARGIGSVLPAPAQGPPPVYGESVWERWTRGAAHVAAFHTARGALAAWLKRRRVLRVWLPAYICVAVERAVHAAGAQALWYDPGPRLEEGEVALAERLQPGDAVLAPAWFGRSPSKALHALSRSRPDVLWIDDRAQALAPEGPVFGAVRLYSPRKLFGVGDGGLLVSDAPLPEPMAAHAPQDDPWAPNLARAADPDGCEPQGWYAAFQAREAAFDVDAAPMDPRTRTALEGLSLAREAQVRQANWRVLAQALPDLALWPCVEPAFAPLAFPLVVPDAGEAAGRMALARVWCARHWAELPSPGDRFPGAHALARGLLSLPLDGRYGAEDMARVADALRRAVQPR